MATVFVKHKVKEFSSWKAAYDAFDAERSTMGVTSQGVYQTDGDPNEVTVYHRFATMNAAKEFMGSPRLKEVMEAAGVVGAPEAWFTNEA